MRPLGTPAGWQYRPAVAGFSKLHFVDAKSDLDAWVPYVHAACFAEGGDLEWDQARVVSGGVGALERQGLPGATYAALPAGALRAANYATWEKTLKTFIYQTVTLELSACPALKQVSRPGEAEGDFRARLGQTMRERRDGEADRLKRQYAPKFMALQEQRRRAQARVEAEKAQYGQQTLQTAISVGATIMGALFGRKAMSVGNMGRATTAVRGAGRAMRERGDIGRATDTVAAVHERLAALQEQFDQAAAQLHAGYDPAMAEFTRIAVRPRKTDIAVSEVALVWLPWHRAADGTVEPLFE